MCVCVYVCELAKCINEYMCVYVCVWESARNKVSKVKKNMGKGVIEKNT